MAEEDVSISRADWDCRFRDVCERGKVQMDYVRNASPVYCEGVQSKHYTAHTLPVRKWLMLASREIGEFSWYAAYTALSIFDHFTCLRTGLLCTKHLVMVGATAIVMASKICGGTLLLPSKFIKIAQEHNEQEYAFIALRHVSDFQDVEIAMLKKLDWKVSNYITVFHYIDLFLEAVEADKHVIEEALSICVAKYLAQEPFTSDVKDMALNCVKEACSTRAGNDAIFCVTLSHFRTASVDPIESGMALAGADGLADSTAMVHDG